MEKALWKYITEEQAAEFLGVTTRTLRDWRFKGQIDNTGTKPPKAYVKGKHIFFDLHELDEWVKQGVVEQAGPRALRNKKEDRAAIKRPGEDA